MIPTTNTAQATSILDPDTTFWAENETTESTYPRSPLIKYKTPREATFNDIVLYPGTLNKMEATTVLHHEIWILTGLLKTECGDIETSKQFNTQRYKLHPLDQANQSNTS